ncbi:MAG: rRNA adenine N-6-methyltransferase family protein [Armatimonadota bacterium]
MSPLAHSQNFLRSAALVKKLITASSITSDDVVIEIGPGKGIITRQLFSRISPVRCIYRKMRI